MLLISTKDLATDTIRLSKEYNKEIHDGILGTKVEKIVGTCNTKL